MSLRQLVVATVLTGLVATLGSALSAATQSANLTVTATVTASCSVSNTTLAFGGYNTTSPANVDQNATLQVACTKGTTATVGLDEGSHASGGARRMSNGTDFLTYQLYKEAARTNVWGNSGSDLVSLAAASSNASQSLTVYGRVPGSQDVSIGSYSDTVLVTVTF
jgi:spore coat protein U-like protein